MELLKLMKLIYLAERSCYVKHGRAMIGDEPMADRHGPVLESVYRAASDEKSAGRTWQTLICPRDGNDIVLRDPNASLKKLSDADRALMDEVWETHKDKTSSDIRNWSHDHCPEYDELSFTTYAPRKPIDMRRALVAEGYTAEEASQLMADVAEQNYVDQQLLKAA